MTWHVVGNVVGNVVKRIESNLIAYESICMAMQDGDPARSLTEVHSRLSSEAVSFAISAMLKLHRLQTAEQHLRQEMSGEDPVALGIAMDEAYNAQVFPKLLEEARNIHQAMISLQKAMQVENNSSLLEACEWAASMGVSPRLIKRARCWYAQVRSEICLSKVVCEGDVGCTTLALLEAAVAGVSSDILQGAATRLERVQTPSEQACT